MNKQDILAEIRTFYQTEMNSVVPRQEGDITYADIMVDTGWSESKARRVMKEAVARGLYRKLETQIGSDRYVIFRKIGGSK